MYFYFLDGKLATVTEHDNVKVDGAVMIEHDTFDKTKTYTLVGGEIISNDIIEENNIIQNYQYLHERLNTYPSIHDQLDMQYWDAINGTTIWLDTITSIKNRYPKPE